jgi:hypothetical protein
MEAYYKQLGSLFLTSAKQKDSRLILQTLAQGMSDYANCLPSDSPYGNVMIM